MILSRVLGKVEELVGGGKKLAKILRNTVKPWIRF
jgi:hypothetical protein